MIFDFSSISQPLSLILKKDVLLVLGPMLRHSFRSLRLDLLLKLRIVRYNRNELKYLRSVVKTFVSSNGLVCLNHGLDHFVAFLNVGKFCLKNLFSLRRSARMLRLVDFVGVEPSLSGSVSVESSIFC